MNILEYHDKEWGVMVVTPHSTWSQINRLLEEYDQDGNVKILLQRTSDDEFVFHYDQGGTNIKDDIKIVEGAFDRIGCPVFYQLKTIGKSSYRPMWAFKTPQAQFHYNLKFGPA